MGRRVAIAGTIAVMIVFAAVVFLVKRGLPDFGRPATPKPTVAAAPAGPAPPGRRIKARLFYVGENGTRLTSVEHDVAYGEGADEQAREIIAAQIAPVV